MNLSVETEVKKIISSIFKVDKSRLTNDTYYVKDLFAKSVNIIELIATLEEKFNIDMPMKEARKNVTIGQTIDYIKKKLK